MKTSNNNKKHDNFTIKKMSSPASSSTTILTNTKATTGTTTNNTNKNSTQTAQLTTHFGASSSNKIEQQQTNATQNINNKQANEQILQLLNNNNNNLNIFKYKNHYAMDEQQQLQQHFKQDLLTKTKPVEEPKNFSANNINNSTKLIRNTREKINLINLNFNNKKKETTTATIGQRSAAINLNSFTELIVKTTAATQPATKTIATLPTRSTSLSGEPE